MASQVRFKVPAGPGLTIGALMLVLGICFSLASVAATESAFMQQVAVYKFSLSIIGQLQDFITGRVTGKPAMAIAWAWGIELMSLVFCWAYEASKDALKTSHHLLVHGIEGVMGLAAIYNVYTNYSFSGMSDDPIWRPIYAIGLTAFTWFFLVVGWKLAQDAMEDYGWFGWGKKP